MTTQQLFDNNIEWAKNTVGIMMSRAQNLSEHDRADAINGGLEGLWIAAQRYDEATGAKFRTFALYYVRGRASDRLRNAPGAIKTARMWKRHRREGTYKRMFDMLPLDVLDDDSAAYRQPEPVDKNYYLNFIRDKRDRYVVDQQFFHGRQISDIGRELGVTPERACQLRARALQQIRRGMESVPVRLKAAMA